MLGCESVPFTGVACVWKSPLHPPQTVVATIKGKADIERVAEGCLPGMSPTRLLIVGNVARVGRT